MGGVRAAERTLVLLDLLATAAPEPVRVADAARALAVSAPSASRLLGTMVTAGYAARTGDRRYTVGPRSLELATRWVGPLRRTVEPTVARLRAATGDAVGVAVLLGDQPAAVDLRVPAAHPVRGRLPGRYLPWSTAAGRSLLATLPEAHRSRLGHGRVDVHDSAHARRGGIFTEHGQADPDLSCYALPLATGRGQVVSLMVVCDRDRPGGVDQDRVRRALHTAAEQLGTASHSR
jgi:DNA-binding IclR family transcriptional regulator